MEIILILLGFLGWIVNLNGWFIFPELAIYWLIGLGMGIAAAKIIFWLVAKHRFNKHFEDFF